MKNILYIGLICASALTFTASCVNEEDDIFDKSAAERLNEASELYSNRLTASPNGWAVQLYPTTEDETPYGNGYLLLFRFHKNKSVDAATYTYLKSSSNENKVWEYLTDTSSWDVITDNGPVLTFNTYNKVVHLFSDPEDIKSTGTAEIPNDETGKGIQGDYEFIIVDAPEDASYMMLKGKKRGTYNLLTPVEEGVDFESYLMDVKAFKEKMFPASAPTFDVLKVRDASYKVEDADEGIPNIYPYNADAIIDQEFNPFLITKRGNDYYLRFRDAKAYNTGSETDSLVTLQEFKYVTDRDAFVSTNDENCYITGDSPTRFIYFALCNKSLQWRWTTSSEMSSSYKSIIDELVSQMSKVKYSLTRFSIVPTDTGYFSLRFAYNYNRRDYSIDYNFKFVQTDTGVKTTYLGAAATGGENALKTFTALQNVIDALTGDLNFSAAETSFDLTNLKVTSGSNSDIWFNVTMYQK